MADPDAFPPAAQGMYGGVHRPDVLAAALDRGKGSLDWDSVIPVPGPSQEQPAGHAEPRAETAHGVQGTLPGWSGDNSPDPWDYCGPIPGRRRAH